MENCWAHCLGNCSGKISREHLISKSLFEGPRVIVTGMPWLLGQTKSISLATLTSKILCTTHNNALGEAVDVEGAKAFKTITDIDRHQAFVKKSDPPRVRSYLIDGNLLERWFLKTAINLFATNNKTTTWQNGNAPHNPPEPLVQYVFGLSCLEPPMGLYSSTGSHIGQQSRIDGGVGYTPIQDSNERYAGALFTFNGIEFLLWFSDQEIPWVKLRELYRHIGVDFVTFNNKCRLRFKW